MMQIVKIFSILILALFIAVDIEGQPLSGTVTVGTSGTYPTLTGTGGLFAAINANGLGGNLTARIISDLSEPSTNTLNLWSVGSTFSVTIQPNGTTVRTISNSTTDTSPLININGAKNVIIDGRDPSNTALNYTNSYLIFSSTRNSPVFLFNNGAANNTIRSCRITGRSNSTSSGNIFLQASATADINNTIIEYNRIYSNGFDQNQIAVYSLGSTGFFVTNTTFQYNLVYDFWRSNQPSSHGLYIHTNNSGWVISNNSFYQTATLSNSANRDNYFIRINNSGSHTITNNFLGGDSPNAAVITMATTTTNSVNYFRMRLIWIDGASTSSATTISGNTITNFSSTNTSGTAQNPVFVGIHANNCFCNITNNYIGQNNSAGGNISVTDNSQGGNVIGINYLGSSRGTIEGNIIGNFNLSSTEGSRSATFAGINNTSLSSSRIFIINNTVRAINISSTRPASTAIIFEGISSTAAAVTIKENNIGSLAVAADANTIHVPTYATVPTTTSFDVYGIRSASSSDSIYANTIGQLNVTGTTIYPVRVSGIEATSTIARTILIAKNTIHKLTQSIGSSIIRGIRYSSSGTSSISFSVINNMITLGTTDNTNNGIRGINFEAAGTGTSSTVYHNSVYINGTATASAVNSFAFYRENTQNTNVRNNILTNKRVANASDQHFAIGSTITTGLISNYNGLYSNVAGTFGLWGSTAYSFADWKTNTLQDVISIGTDQSSFFIDITNGDLRLRDQPSPSSYIDAGTNISEVADDIDDIPRITPDIGASEGYNTWTGAVSTNWTNPGNWSKNVVPTCSTPTVALIRINPSSNPPSIDNNYIFNALYIAKNAVVNFNTAGVSLQECNPSVNSGVFYGVNNQGTINFTANGTLEIFGNLSSMGTINSTSTQGTISMLGSSAQTIFSKNALSVANLTLNGGGTKTLLSPLTVSNQVNLTSGILTTTSTNLLTLTSTASYSGGSTTSFINGPMRRNTNSTAGWIFPVGKDSTLNAVTIAPAATTASGYTVEYFRANPKTTFGTVFLVQAEQLVKVSGLEYWTIDRNTGVDATVTLSFEKFSDVSKEVGDFSELRVARFDGTGWVNEGAAALTGDHLSGTIRSNVITSFSPFTLGSTTFDHPLPVTWLDFTGKKENRGIKLDWSTSTEKDNSHFEILRSTDGINFNKIGKQKGAGTTNIIQNYNFVDRQVLRSTPFYYYKLKQVDYDGNFDYSKIIYIPIYFDSKFESLVYPNYFDDHITIDITIEEVKPVSIELYSLLGEIIWDSEILPTPYTQKSVKIEHLNHLPSGLYLLNISSGEFHKSIKMFKPK